MKKLLFVLLVTTTSLRAGLAEITMLLAAFSTIIGTGAACLSAKNYIDSAKQTVDLEYKIELLETKLNNRNQMPYALRAMPRRDTPPPSYVAFIGETVLTSEAVRQNPLPGQILEVQQEQHREQALTHPVPPLRNRITGQLVPVQGDNALDNVIF